MDGVALARIGVALLAACLIAMLSRRLGLPYIVGLVVAGFLIALLPHSPNVPLSRDLIFNILLPPLVFEAALQLEWKRFRAELPLTLTLAFFGVAIAAAVVAAGMHAIVGWGWLGAALFGVLIAATDPVSVIASFREMGAQPRVSMVVESESLLNDGVAAVGFAILSAIAAGASPTAASIVPAFLWTLGGGLAIGLGIGAAILVLAGRALSIYPLSTLFHRSRWRLPPSFQHTLFWGGLRGALALALALAVPVTVPERGAIILTAFVVVAFSILVQGLTMPWLIKKLDLGRKPPVAAATPAP